MAWYTKSDQREEPTVKNILPSKTLPQVWQRNQKPSRQANVKRVQHHQTSFTTNAKGTSLGRKHKRRKRPTFRNKPKTIKKMVIHYDNCPKCKWIKSTERHWLGGWKHVHVCTSTYHMTRRLPKLYVIILYYHVNHVPIMAYNDLFCLAIDYETDKRLLL